MKPRLLVAGAERAFLRATGPNCGWPIPNGTRTARSNRFPAPRFRRSSLPICRPPSCSSPSPPIPDLRWFSRARALNALSCRAFRLPPEARRRGTGSIASYNLSQPSDEWEDHMDESLSGHRYSIAPAMWSRSKRGISVVSSLSPNRWLHVFPAVHACRLADGTRRAADAFEISYDARAFPSSVVAQTGFAPSPARRSSSAIRPVTSFSPKLKSPPPGAIILLRVFSTIPLRRKLMRYSRMRLQAAGSFSTPAMLPSILITLCYRRLILETQDRTQRAPNGFRWAKPFANSTSANVHWPS